MNGIERFLPSTFTFEAAAAESRAQLREKIEFLKREHADSIIDLNDRSLDWVGDSYVSSWEFGWYFLDIDFDEHPRAREVMVRAAKFGVQIAEDLSPLKIGTIDFNAYLDPLRTDPEGAVYALIREAQGYLNHHDELDTILHIYAMDIDTTDMYIQQAQIVSAMVLMLAERQFAEEYVRSGFLQASVDDFIQ